MPLRGFVRAWLRCMKGEGGEAGARGEEGEERQVAAGHAVAPEPRLKNSVMELTRPSAVCSFDWRRFWSSRPFLPGCLMGHLKWRSFSGSRSNPTRSLFSPTF